MSEHTQTYMAKSVFTDLTLWSALLIGLLQISGVENFLDFLSAKLSTPDFPINLVKTLEALSAIAILIHRTFFANNPVTFIAPREVKPVEVRSLTPTQPADPPKRKDDNTPPRLPQPPDVSDQKDGD